MSKYQETDGVILLGIGGYVSTTQVARYLSQLAYQISTACSFGAVFSYAGQMPTRDHEARMAKAWLAAKMD